MVCPSYRAITNGLFSSVSKNLLLRVFLNYILVISFYSVDNVIMAAFIIIEYTDRRNWYREDLGSFYNVLLRTKR